MNVSWELYVMISLFLSNQENTKNTPTKGPPKTDWLLALKTDIFLAISQPQLV